MAPRMEFFKGAQNFSMGNVEFNTVQGDYHDYSVRNVRNTYGNKNRYYTNNTNSFNDHSNNHNGDYYGPASHYYGPVNNIDRVQNANFGNNYGEINQGTGAQTEGRGGSPPRPAPAGPGVAQGTPFGGPRPGPAPVPNDRQFTNSATAVPQHQGFQQHRGPPHPDPPHRPMSGPSMPEGYQAQAWAQQGPPAAYPPQGPQGYPQHPPQNAGYRPTGPQFSPPPPQQQPQRQQYQPPPQQQRQQPQRPAQESWPGQFAYKQGMQHLQQSSPPTWDMDGSASSDTSDEGSETDSPTRRRAQTKMQKAKMDRPTSKTDSARMTAFDVGITATAVGGATVSVNHSAPQRVGPVPPQGQIFNPFNQGPPPSPSPSPSAPSSRGPTPQPAFSPASQSAPHPASQRAGSPHPPAVQSVTPHKPDPPPVAALAANSLEVPPRNTGLSTMAAQVLEESNSHGSGDDIDVSSINGSSLSLPAEKDKKKKKHRKMFSFLAPKKK